MSIKRIVRPALIGAGALLLGACSLGDYGYGSTSIGYSSGGYYDPYYDGYGRGSGYSAAARAGIPVYYGWYDNLYYPGYGTYVYDRRGTRHGWNSRHQRYWLARQAQYQRWRTAHRDVRLDRYDRRLDALERRGHERRDRWEDRRGRDDRWNRRDRDRDGDRGRWDGNRRDGDRWTGGRSRIDRGDRDRNWRGRGGSDRASERARAPTRTVRPAVQPRPGAAETSRPSIEVRRPTTRITRGGPRPRAHPE